MAHLTVLQRCMLGGASWKSMSLAAINSWSRAEALLLRRWRFGLRPRDWSRRSIALRCDYIRAGFILHWFA